MVGILSEYNLFKVCLRNGNEVTIYILLALLTVLPRLWVREREKQGQRLWLWLS